MPFLLICLSGLKKNQSKFGSSVEESCLIAMPLKMPKSDTSGATGKSPHFRSNK